MSVDLKSRGEKDSMICSRAKPCHCADVATGVLVLGRQDQGQSSTGGLFRS